MKTTSFTAEALEENDRQDFVCLNVIYLFAGIRPQLMRLRLPSNFGSLLCTKLVSHGQLPPKHPQNVFLIGLSLDAGVRLLGLAADGNP
jgi:hypothetical protein